MPTAKPRVQVTLSKAAFRQLSALAKRTSRSMSSIAGEVLNDVLPEFERAQMIAAELRKLPPGMREAKHHELNAMIMQANQGLLDLEQSSGVPSREGLRVGEGPAHAGPHPPSTNRGVRR